MSLTAFVRRVVETLDEAGVSYMLTGSFAAAFYAAPRATQDVDLVFAADRGGVERIVRGFLAEGFYVDEEVALEAWRTHGQFNAIDPVGGWKVDLIVRKERPYSHVEFDRRERAPFLGFDIWITTLEDLVIAKLEWSRLGDSALQRRDVVELLERGRDTLDVPYVEQWVKALGLESEWDRALRASADESGFPPQDPEG